jgi:hypothetical protein
MKVDRATIATAVFVAVVFPFVLPKALVCVVCLFLPMTLLAKVLKRLEAKRQAKQKPKQTPVPVHLGTGRYTLKEEIAFRSRGWVGVKEERIKRLSRYPGGPKVEVVSVIKTFHRLSKGGDS